MSTSLKKVDTWVDVIIPKCSILDLFRSNHQIPLKGDGDAADGDSDDDETTSLVD